MEWLILPLRRYADFSGRSRRIEYWMFKLFSMICLFGFLAIGAIIGGLMGAFDQEKPSIAFWGIAGILLVIYLIIFLVPSIAVAVRRWHDQGQSGWVVVLFAVLSIIPLVGSISGIANIVFMCLPGTSGSNKYGEDPLANGAPPPPIT